MLKIFSFGYLALIAVGGLILQPNTTEITIAETTLMEPESIKLPVELQAIGFCESGNRHFNKDGSVLKGFLNPHDIGEWQINEIVWGEKAKQLGFDIYDQKGNQEMAMWIYQNYGTEPWNWSKPCWLTKMVELSNKP